ncbi:MAG: glycosyltransferase family 2 protein [Lachnospiraceae bacterium]|nr:glycosyltransferase family 2 protein [Lachnospiraceae bacterium]
MRLQVLVSAVNQEVSTLAERMHLESDAVIINQTDHFAYEEYTHNGKRVQCYSFRETGVGLSRNNALLRAEGDIVLFSDEDIVYDKGYERRILDAFAAHPEADFLLFNVRVGETRATYYTNAYHRVYIWNAGRYPTYSFAVRREKLHAAHVTFSLLFGGGAKYSNGEDSLFLKDCLHYGLSVYAVPVEIGAEQERESTWFNGYTDKFFIDRGVLYHFLYGRLAYLMAVRFIMAHGKVMCVEIPRKSALALMRKGIKSVEGM